MFFSFPSEFEALSRDERREVTGAVLRGRNIPPHLEAVAVALAHSFLWLTRIGFACLMAGSSVLITAVASSLPTRLFAIAVGCGALMVVIGLLYLWVGTGPRRVARRS